MSSMSTPNQNPEQIARDKIDAQLTAAGRKIHAYKEYNPHDGEYLHEGSTPIMKRKPFNLQRGSNSLLEIPRQIPTLHLQRHLRGNLDPDTKTAHRPLQSTGDQ